VSQRPATALLAWLMLSLTLSSIPALAQQAQNQQVQNDEMVRRAKSRVEAEYPVLAKKMSLAGTVKIEVVVAPNGTVKDARVVGGHPVLAGAALVAAKKWRFEPAAVESSGIIEFKFEPR
jgi:TonB family protein